MSNRYAWSRKSDDEIWRGGPCDSKQECVQEALDEGYELTDTFAIGIVEEYKIGVDFADDIVYRLSEDAFDEVGEASDGWLDSATKAQLEILNTRVTDVVKEWLKEVGEEPSFYKVAPCQECTLQELSDMIKDNPKGGKVDAIQGKE